MKTPLPEHIRTQWNWGAFWLTFIWGIPNRTYFSLTVLIPIIGLFSPIYLAMKANEWAWENRPWDSVEHFVRVQRRWSIAGWFVFGIMSAAAIIASLYLTRWMVEAIQQY